MAANPNPGTNAYTTFTGPNKYGSSPKDSNREAIAYANGIVTQDFTGRAAATPNAANDLTSPLSLTGATTAQVIVIPPNAVSITMTGSATFNFSEFGTAGSALTQYASVPANTAVTLQTGRQQYLYVEGTGTLSFFFQTL